MYIQCSNLLYKSIIIFSNILNIYWEFPCKLYSIDKVTLEQVIGGARGVKCMLWETSNLDATEGIRFRGLTIPECQELLPTYSGVAGDGEPLLESLLWLLLTSEIPTKEQVDTLTADLQKVRPSVSRHSSSKFTPRIYASYDSIHHWS